MFIDRLKADTLIIGLFAVITGVLFFFFPYLYNNNPDWRNICGVVGFLLVVFGALLRMSAKGYRKINADPKNTFVTSGPYKLVRFPICLGTFFIGVGIILPLFPLWAALVFSLGFYLRFFFYIKKENSFRLARFGDSYADYCRRVPAFIPTFQSIRTVCFCEILSWKYLWSTSEKIGIIFWPVLSLNFWYLQNEDLWSGYIIIPMATNAVCVLAILLWIILCVLEEM